MAKEQSSDLAAAEALADEALNTEEETEVANATDNKSKVVKILKLLRQEAVTKEEGQKKLGFPMTTKLLDEANDKAAAKGYRVARIVGGKYRLKKADTESSKPAKKEGKTRKPRESSGSRLQDDRLPAVGTKLTGTYRKKPIVAVVRKDHIECGGKKYSSLSAAAVAAVSKIRGEVTRINGFQFFGLLGDDKPAKKKTTKPEKAEKAEKAKKTDKAKATTKPKKKAKKAKAKKAEKS